MKVFIQRFKSVFFIFILISLIFTGCTPPEEPAEGNLPEINISKEDRILILAPHPDDEIVGTGGIIEKAMDIKVPVKIAFLTCGDANEWSFLISSLNHRLRRCEKKRLCRSIE